RGFLSSASRASGRSPDCVPPFSARGAAVSLHGRGVDQHLGRWAAGSGQRMEDVEPYPFGRPAHEAIVKRLARPVEERRVRPAATGLQHMHNSFNGYDGPEILVTCRPAGLILVTARWQARGRKIYGLQSPQGSACPRLPFHRTRTVAWAAVEARLRKDGIGWMRWWWALMCQRIGSTWRCVRPARASSSNAPLPGSRILSPG